MKRVHNLEAELRNTVSDRRAVIVIGSGVSIAASVDSVSGMPHPQASWTGLLVNGLEWLRDHKLIDTDVAEAQLKLLSKNPPTHRYLSAAEDVMTGMGGAKSQHFARWLKETVGTIRPHDRGVLDALESLHQRGNRLATTNYDGLLLGDSDQRTPITWKDREAFLSAARGDDPQAVLFLHGYWRKPESVVLDWKSYDEIARDEHYRNDLSAFWKMTTWVYVGCGMSGLSDPDFGLLLERHGARARNVGHYDFCLVRQHDRAEFQAYFDNHNYNICAIAFGYEHRDLPLYLHSLLPSPISIDADTDPESASLTKQRSIPKPPALYAEPDYIGSHKFVGRTAELQTLDDWARPADQTNLLLFEAIGGNGKSMLTWEWTTNPNYAPAMRNWAGRFWYSFYEKGAVMADFCRRALAYMTGRPLGELEKKRTPELAEDLLAQLHGQPWLLVLDGLERVLVAYHRIDAAEVPDEEANAPTDKVLTRDPCDTIRDEDGDLLRSLAAAFPSKVLISSRLTPRVLLNPSGQPIGGAKRITLPGLRPADAEQLLRSCEITGDSARIREYLTQNCDNHPLVIGVLAGLINSPGSNRGNFDGWLTDPTQKGGARLDLGKLNLIQRRNHILRVALDALPEDSRKLLSTLALLSESVEYDTLAALNPHLPPMPSKPVHPDEIEFWQYESPDEEESEWQRKEYDTVIARWEQYEKALKAWHDSPRVRNAPQKLLDTVKDLEERGLLQYDRRTRRHDLHPVVRAVAATSLAMEDKQSCGQRVIDYFSSLPHSPYDQASTLEDVAAGLQLVRTLVKVERFEAAADVFCGDLSNALIFNLEAYVEVLALLKSFFPTGWNELPRLLDGREAYLANNAALALSYCGEFGAALAVEGTVLNWELTVENWRELNNVLYNMSRSFAGFNLLSKALRADAIMLEFADSRNDKESLFLCRLALYADQSRVGYWQDASKTWRLLDQMGRKWRRPAYRQGRAEYRFAQSQFWQGSLKQNHIDEATRLAELDSERITLRDLHRLCGTWRLEMGDWALAASRFHEAVSMAREKRLTDEESEAGLALAKFHLGQFSKIEARHEAARLASQRNPNHRFVAMLWHLIENPEEAEKHALAAYKWAWSDGEPYVNRYELTKTAELLTSMKVPIPVLSPYDPSKNQPFIWEPAVREAIDKLRAKKKTRRPRKH
ncbi:MAG TPA: SIR2 family protein [Pyrinomonadaceae bacterium]|nr:SIR2 family protein [Pyrinomonadaceae bacterium]